MDQVSEHIRRANQAGIQTIETAASLALETMEKLAALNLGMVKDALEQRETNSRKLVTVTKPETLVTLQAGMFLEGSRQAMDYSQRVMEIGNATRNSLSRLVAEQIPGSSRGQRKKAA